MFFYRGLPMLLTFAHHVLGLLLPRYTDSLGRLLQSRCALLFLASCSRLLTSRSRLIASCLRLTSMIRAVSFSDRLSCLKCVAMKSKRVCSLHSSFFRNGFFMYDIVVDCVCATLNSLLVKCNTFANALLFISYVVKLTGFASIHRTNSSVSFSQRCWKKIESDASVDATRDERVRRIR
jgi:hypothetical protein